MARTLIGMGSAPQPVAQVAGRPGGQRPPLAFARPHGFPRSVAPASLSSITQPSMHTRGRYLHVPDLALDRSPILRIRSSTESGPPQNQGCASQIRATRSGALSPHHAARSTVRAPCASARAPQRVVCRPTPAQRGPAPVDRREGFEESPGPLPLDAQGRAIVSPPQRPPSASRGTRRPSNDQMLRISSLAWARGVPCAARQPGLFCV